ncbi:MAG: hypothetical protein ACSHX6_10390 [Akkermansiaceae bacterium]
MILNLVIVAVVLLLGSYLAFSPKLSNSSAWNATVTPLASIMGSGFLVSAPLLGSTVGYYAVFCMMILLIVAYGVGSVMRFNIKHFEPIAHQQGITQKIARTSQIVLAIAYFISITYYLQLLAAFSLSAIGTESEIISNILTTSLLVFIGSIGLWKGLAVLESLEKYAVALNLGMIGALLVALAYYNIHLTTSHQWQLPNIDSNINFNDIRVLLGLLIVVQGFETSRYLGDKHSADERIRTMRIAQIISSAIYIIFLALVTVLFQSDMSGNVTAIIQMTTPIAVILPIMLTIAAIGSQFTAAVADDEGAGGLIEEITNNKIPIRYAYLLILIVTVAITWLSNVNSIIAYASRAFALYYFIQCLLAIVVLKQTGWQMKRGILFYLLCFICLLVVTLGLPSE